MEEPNKYIRSYFVSAFADMVVNGKPIKVYDTHTPNNDDNLIILSTQTGSNDRIDKCSITKNRTIEIQIMTRFKGMSGSRVMIDDILEEIQKRVKTIQIDNFTVQDWDVSFSQDFATTTTTETIFRKIINYNLIIK